MFNLKHKLVIDDLIILYLAEKLKCGCDNSLEEKELSDFLKYFNENKKTKFHFENYQELIQRVIDKKTASEWMNGSHIYVNDDKVVRANYNFSNLDENMSFIYFMNKDERLATLKIIKNYLSNLPKRHINIQLPLEKDILEIGFLYSALMVDSIWENYMNKYALNGLWPKQCFDIEKYLLENDLASIIDLPSIRENILCFYDEFAIRIATLVELEKKVEISNSKANLLAYSNFMYCTSNFDTLMNFCTDKRYDMFINLNNNLSDIYPSLLCRESKKNSEEKNAINNVKAQRIVKLLNNYKKDRFK